MNLLLLNLYYPPDVAPTGHYLHDLARRLVARGHTVRVLASRTSYNGESRYPKQETLDGVEIERVGGLSFGRRNLLLKAIEYAGAMVGLAIRLRTLRPTPDFILCLTTPPFAGALVRACRRQKTPYGHWVMDLYPDVLFAHGLLNPNNWIARRLIGLARYTIDGGAFAVALGDDMAQRMAPYAGQSDIIPLPLWSLGRADSDEEAVRSLRRERGWTEDETVFMYSGNMGRGHRFAEFLAAIESTAHNPAIRWVFAGDGKRRGEIEAFAVSHPEARLTLLPYVPTEQLTTHQLSGNVHLMSLDKQWKGCMIPSKIQAICHLGRPIIFVGGRGSSPAQWIEDYQAGWVVEEGDVAALQNAVKSALDARERARRGEGAQRLAEEVFGVEQNVNHLCELIETHAHNAVS